MTRALLLLVLTGLSWVSVGAVVGRVGRRGLSLPLYQVFLCFVCMVCGAANWLASPTVFLPQAGCPAATWAGVLEATLLCGVFEYLMIQVMGRAMAHGPHSTVWAVIQSGVVFPFLMGSLFFGVPIGPSRLAGIALVVTSVFLHSSARDNAGTSDDEGGNAAPRAPLRAWLVPALLGMLCCGTNQCCANLPSYLERGQEFSGAFRTLLCYVGILLAAAVHFVVRWAGGAKPSIPTRAHAGTLAAYAIGVGVLSFATSQYLRFPGLDILQRHHCGSMGYPVMVASCIAGFFVYGVAVLRERPTRRQWLGVVCALSGIALVALC